MRPSGNTHTPRAVLVVTLCLLSSWKTRAFVVRNENTFRRDGISLLLSGPTDLQDPANMRLREIQSELKKRKVSFDDCFDRDSLTKRLMEARESTSSNSESEKGESEQISSDASSDLFDREATMTELRTQRIKSLREQLSQYNVRWGNMIEKEELVKALCDTLEDRFLRSKNFSRSGQVLVGEVCDATEDALVKELGWLDSDLNRGVITPVSAGSNPNTYAPLLLDVYATWCGPCQFMAPHFKEAAKEFGPDVRVVKLDSDKHPRIASALKVNGLPSVILFDGGDIAKEVERIEGALTKDQLVGFVKKHF